MTFLRELAHNGRIAWTEYWNFLGGYADLSSSQGLDKLDDYLAKKNDRIILSRLSVTPQRVRAVRNVSNVLKTPESRQSSVILNDNGLLHQTSDFEDCNDNDMMDVHDSPSSSSWKVLFSDSELDSMQEGELQHLKQHNILEKFTSPVNESTNTESCEPVVEALTQSLDKLSLHQEQGVPETMLDISLAENPGKKDLLTEVSDRRDETDNGYQCKKKLSYNDPETKLLESRGDDLSGAAAMETDEKIEDCKRSAILHNTTNEKTSSSSLPMQNQPLHDLKENLFVDEVFENTTGTDLRLRKNDCITSTDTEQGSFKMPAIRNVDHMKSGSCNNGLGLGKRNIGTFIQG